MRFALIPLLLLAFAAPAGAAKMPEKVTVNATTIFMHGEDPADPGHCTAAVFGQFPEKKGYVAQNWTTAIQLSDGATRPASEALTPPDFGDTYTFGAIVWKAPAPAHWAFISHTYQDGPARCDGSVFEARYRASYQDPIVITYGLTEACESAIGNVDTAKLNVKYAKKRLKGTSGKARKDIQKQLKGFQKYLKRSQTKVKKSC